MVQPDGRPNRRLHVVIGSPDEENCPICKAHALGRGDRDRNGAPEPILIQELTLTDILRCPCPLCCAAREKEDAE